MQEKRPQCLHAKTFHQFQANPGAETPCTCRSTKAENANQTPNQSDLVFSEPLINLEFWARDPLKSCRVVRWVEMGEMGEMGEKMGEISFRTLQLCGFLVMDLVRRLHES